MEKPDAGFGNNSSRFREIREMMDATAELEHTVLTLAGKSGEILYSTGSIFPIGGLLPAEIRTPSDWIFTVTEEKDIYFARMPLGEDLVLFLGPLCSRPLSRASEVKFFRQTGIQDRAVLPLISFPHCRNIMKLLKTALKLSFEAPPLIDPVPASPGGPKSASAISDRIVSYQLQRMDETPHHSYAMEKKMKAIIMTGDEKAALSFFREMDSESVGQMAFSNLKSEEYSAVLMVSFMARYAMEGGVEPLDAYALNDLYLQQISLADSPEAYAGIMGDAVTTFCRYIRKAKKRSSEEYLVRRCKAYVRKNLRQDLSLKKIAGQLGLNPAYLSHTFSVQSGMSLTSYIQQERVEAAKDMLCFTDHSLSDIAHYLGFSSQSYFGAVFQKYTHKTPAKYRQSSMLK